MFSHTIILVQGKVDSILGRDIYPAKPSKNVLLGMMGVFSGIIIFVQGKVDFILSRNIYPQNLVKSFAGYDGGVLPGNLKGVS